MIKDQASGITMNALKDPTPPKSLDVLNGSRTPTSLIQVNSNESNNSGHPTTINNDNPTLYTTSPHIKIRFYPTADRIRNNVCKGNIIISKDLPPKVREDGKTYNPKAFALVNDYIELFYFINSTEPFDRNFYDVVSAEMDQKPRFDLDFPHDKFPNITRDQVYMYLQQVLDAIAQVMIIYNVTYSFKDNCLVFNSHGISNGHFKYSFHIIIDKLVHQGVSAKELALYGEVPEARSFYKLVLDQLPDESKDLGFLDSAVYSSFQNFRLPWSQKKGSGRPKILDPITQYVPYYEYDPNDPPEINDARKKLALLQASLLGSSSGCQYLPSFINKQVGNNKIKYNRQINSSGARDELTEAQYNALIAAFNKQPYSTQYDIGEVNGMSIALHRKRSGKCPIHIRVHDAVGAYLVFDRHGNFWFNCHRYDNGVKQRGISIGCISERLEDYNVDDNINESDDNNEIEPTEGLNTGDFGIISPPDTLNILDMMNNNNNTITISLYDDSPIIKRGNDQIQSDRTQQNQIQKIQSLLRDSDQIQSDRTQQNQIQKIQPLMRDNDTYITNSNIEKSNDFIICSKIIPVTLKSNILPQTNGTLLTSTFLSSVLEPKEGEYTKISTLYAIYFINCDTNKLISEHTTQTSFTRSINKLYPTTRKTLGVNKEPVILGYCLKRVEDISQTDNKRVIAQPVITQNVKLDITSPTTVVPLTLNVIQDPIKIFLTETLREFKTGYTIVKRLYNDLCNHCVKNNIQCTYTSQRGFTMDLTKKYGYDVINKYYDGKYQSVIKGYVHKKDIGRENLKKTVKSNIHRSNYRKILKDAIILDDPRVRPILDMINQGHGITHEQFVLMIKGACGIEKTTRMVEYIQQNRDILKKILFITNRISLADKHKEDLAGLAFTMYYDEKTDKYIRGERIICQIDSLYKLLAEEPFDLVVFDEFTATMTHLVSFVKNQRACNNILEELIMTVPRIIIADALLDERYIDYVRMLGRDDISTYQYTHRPHIDKTYSIIENKLELVRLICYNVRKGKKVVIPTNIEWLGSSLADMIRTELPNIRIGLYTAKTRKKNHIDVTNEWQKLDVLIYTPTIQCGLSFTEKHFDVIYGYFSRSSCLPGPALQMLFRCRCVTKIRICIDDTGGKKDLICKNPNVKTLNEYKAYVVRNYNGAKGQDLFERSYLNGRTNTGTPYYHLYCTVAQDQGEGYRNYEAYLGAYLREMGVNYIEDDYEEDEKIGDEEKAETHEVIKETLKENKEKKKKDEEDKRADAQRVDDKTAGLIKRSDKDIEDIRILKKHNICKEYGVEGYDGIFGTAAAKLMRVHRNTRIYNEVAKHPYGSEIHKFKMNEAMEIMTSRKHDEDIFEFEGDRLKDLQRVYQGGLCELAMNIIELLKVDKTKNVFHERIDIQYNDSLDQYMLMAADFVEGYFKEDWQISKLYSEKKYKTIIKKILDKAFGLKCNFKENYIESPFKVENGTEQSPIDKFYPKVGEYRNNRIMSEMIYIPLDENEIQILTPEDMSIGLK
jgi:ribosomal protein S25